MPSPETTAIVRNDLGTIAWEYLMDIGQRGFIGLEIFPIFSVPKKEGVYPIITVESMLKIHKTERAARSGYNRSDYTFGSGNYTCAEHGFEELLDDTERELYGDSQIDAESIAVLRALNVVLTNQEIRILVKLLSTASLPNGAVGTSWSTAATATPRKNVIDAIETMRSTYGVKPNKMVIAEKTKNDLLLTAEITDALKFTNPIELGGVKAQLLILAQYFGVDEVMVAGGQKDAAKKGQGKSLADLWTNTVCGLYRTSDSRDLKQPSIGRSFLWEGDSPENIMTEQYRAESNRSDVFRTRQFVGEEYTFAGAAHLLTGV
jgi:hypothetical protein